MKISQLTTDQAADALLLIAPDIEILMQDEGLIKLLNERKPPKNKEDAEKLGKTAMLKTVKYLLQNRRQNVWNLIGALNEKSADEIAKQPIMTTAIQLFELLQDKDLIGFFTQLGRLGQVL